jgi:hypothetical protein
MRDLCDYRTPVPGEQPADRMICELQERAGLDELSVDLIAVANAVRLRRQQITRIQGTVAECYGTATTSDGIGLRVTCFDSDSMCGFCSQLTEDSGLLILDLKDVTDQEKARRCVDSIHYTFDGCVHADGVDCGSHRRNRPADDTCVAPPAVGSRQQLTLTTELAGVVAGFSAGERAELAARIARRIDQMVADGHQTADVMVAEVVGASRLPHRHHDISRTTPVSLLCPTVTGDLGLLWAQLDDRRGF